METQRIELPTITLSWSEWVRWDEIPEDARTGGVYIPSRQKGVYEVRRAGDDSERLTIGKAADLRHRVRQGLVKGKTKHSTGTRIRANEDPMTLEVRWAPTEWPAAAEEALHRIYRDQHNGRLPVYTKLT